MAKIGVKETPPPPEFKFSTMVYIFLGVMTIFMIFDNTMRMSCGMVMGTFLQPLIGFNGEYPHLTFLAAGAITGVISITVRQFTMDPIETAKIQKDMRWVNQYRMDAIKNKSPAKLKKAQEIQIRYAEANFKMMKQNLKGMVVTMVIVISVFAWLYMFLIGSVRYPVISVPWSSDVPLMQSTVLPHWILLYSLVTLPVSQIYQKVLKYIYFSKKAREEHVG